MVNDKNVWNYSHTLKYFRIPLLKSIENTLPRIFKTILIWAINFQFFVNDISTKVFL